MSARSSPIAFSPARFVVRHVPLLVVLVAATAVCSNGSDSSPSGPVVPSGVWGGDHLRLDVSASGAQAEFDCAHGAVTEAMTLDRSGRFDVAGTFTPETPGPQRLGQAPQPQPARYAGRVQGSTLTVTVTLTEGREAIGSFTLTRGREAQLVKCL